MCIVAHRSINMMEETYLMEHIKEQACFVSQNLSGDLRAAKAGKHSCIYVLPDGVSNGKGYLSAPLTKEQQRQAAKEGKEARTPPSISQLPGCHVFYQIMGGPALHFTSRPLWSLVNIIIHLFFVRLPAGPNLYPTQCDVQSGETQMQHGITQLSSNPSQFSFKPIGSILHCSYLIQLCA